MTTTAEGFFAKVGFQRIDRKAVPAAVASTTEFKGICPSAATCMTLTLRAAATGA